MLPKQFSKSIFCICLGAFIIGCSFSPGDPTITSPSVTIRPLPSDTPIKTSPITRSTETPTMIPPVTHTPVPDVIELRAADFHPYCPAGEFNQTEISSQAVGIAIANLTESKFLILGNTGIENPLYAFPLREQKMGNYVISPSREWLGYASQINNQRYYTIFNPRSGTEIKREIPNEYTHWRSAQWVSESTLVIPISDIYEEESSWLIWDPFSGAEYTIELNLVGLGDSETKGLEPVFDPLLEYLIYSCTECGGKEYIVLDVNTNEIAWEIDYEDNWRNDYRRQPVWSPDGEYVAFMFGLHHFLIFNRLGEKISDYILPHIETVGFYSGGSLNWSPNSELITFARNLPNDYGDEERLTIYSLDERRFYDVLEIDPDYFITWSPDGTKISVLNHPYPQNEDEQAELVIVDLVNCTTGHILDFNQLDLIGWLLAEP